jgi:hypothetical protein
VAATSRPILTLNWLLQAGIFQLLPVKQYTAFCDGGQQAVAGRLFVPAGHSGQFYAASRSVAVRISVVLLILRLEHLSYYR